MYIILTAPNFRCAAHHHQNRASKTSRRLSNHRGARKIKLIEFDIEKMAVENEMKESDGNRTEITNHIKSYSILCVCEAPLCLFIGFRECRCAPFNENNAHRESE